VRGSLRAYHRYDSGDYCEEGGITFHVVSWPISESRDVGCVTATNDRRCRQVLDLLRDGTIAVL
jgi:hypothetical protein